MSVPGVVEEELEGEIAARVPLSGDDEVFVTENRTLVYRAGGMLSDESVEAYSHGAERLSVTEGRRKSTLTFEYAVGDDRELPVPNADIEAALQPILASVLRETGVTDPDERFVHAFRFSELTLVITSERLLRHLGPAIWDEEYEQYHYADVADLEYEEGSVATGIVLTVDGRKERIKTPNDRLSAVRERFESALFSYRGIESAEELAPPEDDSDDEAKTDDGDTDPGDVTDSLGGIDPLDAGSGDADESEDGDVAIEDAESGEETTGEDDDSDESTPFTESLEPATPDPAVADELEALRDTVERQTELLERQSRAIEQLAERIDED